MCKENNEYNKRFSDSPAIRAFKAAGPRHDGEAPGLGLVAAAVVGHRCLQGGNISDGVYPLAC